MVWGDQTYTDIAPFRAATGMETHGLAANPRVKAAGTAGVGRLPLEAYRLLPDSPCRGAGSALESGFGRQDYWGKSLQGSKSLNIGPGQ